jgi:hypothetical protein
MNKQKRRDAMQLAMQHAQEGGQHGVPATGDHPHRADKGSESMRTDGPSAGAFVEARHQQQVRRQQQQQSQQQSQQQARQQVRPQTRQQQRSAAPGASKAKKPKHEIQLLTTDDSELLNYEENDEI